jgi:hypothetical protein
MLKFINRAQALLDKWLPAAEAYWYLSDDDPQLGCYGPGYIHWGVQSNWNYLAAAATLSAQPNSAQSGLWRSRALASLRFALGTHLTGGRLTNDGRNWGHGWISMLGIERAMHGVAQLEPFFEPEDHTALRRVLTSEADWLLNEFHYKGYTGIPADPWNSSGRNAPESNIWSGCLLWRSAQRYPDHPNAAAWEERARIFLQNGISVAADASDQAILDGQPVRQRHAGSNYFPHYALDHHGYLNIGYMAICVSNAAILHFDLQNAGQGRTSVLDHHQADLWAVLRRMIFPDGRLARIGGDSRVRYSYCQEYLLPALLYAASHLNDPHALTLLDGQLGLYEQEAAFNQDGFFYSQRLAHLRTANPHYYSRLESDRACVLAMLLNYAPLVTAPTHPQFDPSAYEHSVSGEWCEPEHGAVLSRSPTRLASYAWRAHGLTQAMCQPPDRSDLAEWSLNLAPVVRFLGDPGLHNGAHRRLLHQSTQTIPGGFITCGSVMEGVAIRIDEGAETTDQAVSHLAFAALPDGRTCLGLQLVIASPGRVGYLVELKGLHLNLPNDLFNGFQRRLQSASGEYLLNSPDQQPGLLSLDSVWVSIDEILGLRALYGGDSLSIQRPSGRNAGKYDSLYVDEICLTCQSGARRVAPNTHLLDLGFAVLSGSNAHEVQNLAGGSILLPGMARGAWVTGADGLRYSLVANFGQDPVTLSVDGQDISLAPGEARLLPG